MGDTSIAWTDKVWNPVTGCTKVSQGCKNCYAERIFHRPYPGRAFTDVRCHPERLDEPLHARKPKKWFVNSMSDLFHEDVPFAFIEKVHDVIREARQHTFQILTKRPARMLEYWRWREREYLSHSQQSRPPENAWYGVSVEDQATADERIPLLLQTPAAIRFVSYEPALDSVYWWVWLKPYRTQRVSSNRWQEATTGVVIRQNGPSSIDWIIVGGESGPKARPFNIEWARSTIEQCKTDNVPVFVKQLGARAETQNIFDLPTQWAPDTSEPIGLSLRDRAGADPAEWPEDLRVREFPK